MARGASIGNRRPFKVISRQDFQCHALDSLSEGMVNSLMLVSRCLVEVE